MASTAYLDIALESLVYTYEVEILSDPVRVSELREGRIEADKVELEVYTDPDNPDLADQLLFWDNPASVGRVPTELGEDFSLPARIRWQPSGEAPTAANTSDYAITGRLERRGVSGRRMYPGDSTCVWTLDIEVVAQRLLEEALEQIDLRDPAVVEELQADTSLYYEMQTWIRPEGAEDDTQDVAIQARWWDVREVLRWCLDETGVLASYTLDGVWRLDVDYDVGNGAVQKRRDDLPVAMCQIEDWEPSGTDPQYATDNTVLPDLTAYDLWARLVDLHGWVVEARHAGFPSTQIRLEAQDATMPPITDARDGTLDTDASLSTMAWTEQGYDLYHEEAAVRDFALGYLNDPLGDTAYPEAAKYAALERRINQDLEAYNDGLRTVDFRLPRNRSGSDWGPILVTDGDYEEQVRGLEPILLRDQESDVHLAELYNDAGTYRSVLQRIVQAPTPSQSTVVGALYVRERLPAHAMHVGSRRVIEGEADLVAWVTDTQSPFEARPGSYAGIEELQYAQHIFAGEDLPWVPERLEWDYTRDTAQLRMVWPHKLSLARTVDPDQVPFSPPDAADITATKEEQEYVDEQGNYLRVVWIVRIEVDGELQSTWTYQRRTLDSTSTVVLTAPDFSGTSWTEIWEADDPNNPPATPPATPPEYLDSEDAQVRILDQADGSTTAWSASSAIADLGTETIILEGQ